MNKAEPINELLHKNNIKKIEKELNQPSDSITTHSEIKSGDRVFEQANDHS
jgi:hypothetical protein